MTYDDVNIMVIDDARPNLQLLTRILSQEGYQVRAMPNAEKALRSIAVSHPDLILLDINMPIMDGYELCEKLKKDQETADISVIFISSLNEVANKVKGFSVGGVDYITKPFEAAEVLARVENQLTLQRLRHQLQELNQQLEQRVAERTLQLEQTNQRLAEANEELSYEIMQHRVTQKKLLDLALHDSLTNLPNRVLLMEKLESALNEAEQSDDYRFAVFFLDCDHFKVVNDSLGHIVGDKLLQAIATRLQNCISPHHTLARFGGDEFVILMTEVDDLEKAVKLAQEIQRIFSMPFQLPEWEIFVDISIGIVLHKPAYDTAEIMLRNADIAMYQAKAMGRGRYKVFDERMFNEAMARMHLETNVRQAWAKQQFIVYYQPIVSLKTGKLSGFEALVRWKTEDKIIAPAKFISVAEETGLIRPLGQLVLYEACRQLQAWQNEFTDFPITISVNISGLQFLQENLVEQILHVLEETQIKGSYLKLEITETAIMNNPEAKIGMLNKLKEHQIQLCIDDFGTGYSSFSYLHRFPFDTLKIDRSFVTRIEEENTEIVKAIIDLAHNLDLDVIAEGIETANQLKALRKLHCEYGQGFFFAKPLPQENARELLRKNHQW